MKKLKKSATSAVIGAVTTIMVMAFTLLLSMAPQSAKADPPSTPFVLVDFCGPPVSSDITRNDGTINPTVFGIDVRPGIGETASVSRNCEPGKKWDLIGIGFQPNVTPVTSALWVVSGFDPRSTSNTGGFGFQTVFIDTDGSLIPQFVRNGDGYVNRTNSEYGYEYALNVVGVSGNTLTYQLVGLSPSSILQTGYFGQNGEAPPWALIPSSADYIVFTKTTEVHIMDTSDTLATTGVDTGGAYDDQFVWDFEVATDIFKNLSPQTTARFDASTGCNNDETTGGMIPINVSAVPEPGSLIALACFIASGFSIRRRTRGLI